MPLVLYSVTDPRTIAASIWIAERVDVTLFLRRDAESGNCGMRKRECAGQTLGYQLDRRLPNARCLAFTMRRSLWANRVSEGLIAPEDARRTNSTGNRLVQSAGKLDRRLFEEEELVPNLAIMNVKSLMSWLR